jgi:hypothetical protein
MGKPQVESKVARCDRCRQQAGIRFLDWYFLCAACAALYVQRLEWERLRR